MEGEDYNYGSQLNAGGSDVKPATARQVLIGIKLHAQAVLLNDIANKVTRIALDIFADLTFRDHAS